MIGTETKAIFPVYIMLLLLLIVSFSLQLWPRGDFIRLCEWYFLGGDFVLCVPGCYSTLV